MVYDKPLLYAIFRSRTRMTKARREYRRLCHDSLRPRPRLRLRQAQRAGLPMTRT